MENEATLGKLRQVGRTVGLTHYVAILRDQGLRLTERLGEAGARGIPFHWLDLSREDPFIDAPVAGYKLHPRQTKTGTGVPWLATADNMGDLCERAASERRPLFFHTDGDDPNPASVPMLAELAQTYPHTTIIAGHSGVYAQECFVVDYRVRTCEAVMEPQWRQNLRLFIEIPNLYGDTTKFGMDFPWRSHDPQFRFKAFVRAMESFTRTERAILVDKLFVGTDFPYFHYPDDEPNAPLRGTGCVENSHLVFQYRCMREAFGGLLDEDRMLANFLRLLPEGFARLSDRM